jgi:very-short-patch-repair endonuclease
MEERAGERRLVFPNPFFTLQRVNPTAIARRLRGDQTEDEKQLWRALRAGRFAGFKFRRQHPIGIYFLDFYCPAAKLSVELDGSQHGLPEQHQRDEERKNFLAAQGIEELRFWNHQWRNNCEGVLLEIWKALHRRTGCAAVMRKIQNHRYVPPKAGELMQAASSPRPSPPSAGGEGEAGAA